MLNNIERIEYRENNSIIARYHVVDEKLHGPYLGYCENGKLQCKMGYELGELNGICYFYDDNEEIIQILRFQKNVLHGRALLFNNNELVSYSKYKNGKLNGLTRTYYPGRIIQSTMNYTLGKLDGTVCYFDIRGYIIHQAEYRGGQLHGSTITYHDNQILKIEKYSNNQLIGVEDA
ncbi:Toxin-antitoxin system YwqK family antitoxin (plasmid) [Candidatus Trichorickettsia mobilis]|uniref:toxin-antitoxin system YwqK family antitoxin n=1 Tax=Candidatus Trichorickettsia mobilis TaxID=1346319 RepID=UPI002B2588A8|nr:hypothetical protein [Candidatus Trichorickettsia mobilis]WPY01679.1 Toxin-antitoxin system YwqK family antitoxin [Candidatus Trichorickettsia mobilis]